MSGTDLSLPWSDPGTTTTPQVPFPEPRRPPLPAGLFIARRPGFHVFPCNSAKLPATEGGDMNELFQLSAPWWHFVLRAVAIYLMVMVLVRVSGKRAVGQFTPFDLVLLILIGNAVQNGLNGGDNSMTGAAVLA